MTTTLTNIRAITNKNREDVQSLERNFLMLRCCNIKLDAYTREIINIFNIKENGGEMATESLVHNILRDKMKILKEDNYT